MRAFYRHERFTGPDLLTMPGHRDLTADVNFDDLARWGFSLGLRTISLQTQRDFLLPHFAAATPSAIDRFLIDAHGPGTAFKVLRQLRE